MLAAADVVAVPSHLESLNKVCIEAAAVGTPFIVTDTTGISAWVRGEGVGIVVPPADPVALEHALRNVLSGPWKIDLEKCSAFVKPFTPQAVASGMVDIYRAILDSRLSHRTQSP
jgi:glycosyltransferase involved in cell wall biosynthesis